MEAGMTKTLAVFTPQLGTVSETFVRRHIEDLLPGRTVVVAGRFEKTLANERGPPYPVLFLDRWPLRLSVRLAKRAGASEARMRDAAVGRFLRRHGVKIVLGEYLHYLVDFVPLLDGMKIPYVVQGHGIDLSSELQKQGSAQKYQRYHSARAVLTRCEFHRKRLIDIGLPASQIHVNPGGVDVSLNPRTRDHDSCRRFLAIGRMVAKKGPIYLLEAFRLAADRNPNITLDYVGGGELFPAAREFVRACGLTKRVRLHGTAPEELKQRLLQECGVFVQHSITDPVTGDEEGLPAAIQEAMAHAMAVVSTRHAGIPDAVEHGRMGWLVAEGDALGMAEGMLAAAANPDGTKAAGLAGYARAAAQYKWVDEKRRLMSFVGQTGAARRCK
jgi:glycosyltransferase involved in cell wall biosynthesis